MSSVSRFTGGRLFNLLGSVSLAFILISGILLSTINSIAEQRELPRFPLSNIVGAAKLSEVRFLYATNGGRTTQTMVERSREAFVSSPLSTDPLLFAALAYFPNKDSLGAAEAEPMLEEVLRRDPRSRGAHILLLRRALAERNLSVALFHLSRLKVLEPDLVGQLMRMLGTQITSAKAADEAAKALPSYPDLANDLIEGVASGKASPEVIARFASALPRAVLAKSSTAPTLVNRLVKDDFVAQARSIWADSNKLNSSEYTGPIFDPGFAQGQARPPFGWAFLESETGVSEWRGPGSVYVEYYGRQSGALLEETIALLPGRYRATIEFSPEAPSANSIALRLVCSGGEPELLQAPLAEVKTRTVRSIQFQVPRSCNSQVVSVVGLPSENRSGGAVLLHRLAIDRLDDLR